MKYKYLCLIVAILCTIVTAGIIWFKGPIIMIFGFVIASVLSWRHYRIYGK